MLPLCAYGMPRSCLCELGTAPGSDRHTTTGLKTDPDRVEMQQQRLAAPRAISSSCRRSMAASRRAMFSPRSIRKNSCAADDRVAYSENSRLLDSSTWSKCGAFIAAECASDPLQRCCNLAHVTLLIRPCLFLSLTEVTQHSWLTVCPSSGRGPRSKDATEGHDR